MDEVRGGAVVASSQTIIGDRCTLRFRGVATPDVTPRQEDIYLAGNFNDWDARDEGARLARDPGGYLDQASRGVIVIAPDNGPMQADEFAPWRDEDNAVGGLGDKHVDFLVQTLKPCIDAHFSRRPQAEA